MIPQPMLPTPHCTGSSWSHWKAQTAFPTSQDFSASPGHCLHFHKPRDFSLERKIPARRGHPEPPWAPPTFAWAQWPQPPSQPPAEMEGVGCWRCWRCWRKLECPTSLSIRALKTQSTQSICRGEAPPVTAPETPRPPPRVILLLHKNAVKFISPSSRNEAPAKRTDSLFTAVVYIKQNFDTLLNDAHLDKSSCHII